MALQIWRLPNNTGLSRGKLHRQLCEQFAIRPAANAINVLHSSVMPHSDKFFLLRCFTYSIKFLQPKNTAKFQTHTLNTKVYFLG